MVNLVMNQLTGNEGGAMKNVIYMIGQVKGRDRQHWDRMI